MMFLLKCFVSFLSNSKSGNFSFGKTDKALKVRVEGVVEVFWRIDIKVDIKVALPFERFGKNLKLFA